MSAEHQMGLPSVCSPLLRTKAATSIPIFGLCAMRNSLAVSPSTSETRAPLPNMRRTLTINVALNTFRSVNATQWGPIMAGSTVAVLPIELVYQLA